MHGRFSLIVLLATSFWSAAAMGQEVLPFPQGIWVGEYTCRGKTMPLMLEFDSPDKPSSVAYLLNRKKQANIPAKFHANVEQITNKKGEDILIFKPRYWLNNPGQKSMLKLRGKYTAETIRGNIKKKGCQTFQVQKLPCETIPEACSEAALGPLHALLGNAKAPAKPKSPKAAKNAAKAAAANPAQNQIELTTMGDHQFKTLLNQLKDQPFQKGQIAVLSRWVHRYKMSSQQVATVLKLQRFQSDRLEVLKLLAGSVSDMENINVVLDVMRFREERKAAERIIFERTQKAGQTIRRY